jgi:hypothetical protein
VPYYLKHVPLRRVSPIFALSFGYIVAAVREVGMHADEGVRPRIVISGAVTIAVLAFVLLAVSIVRTYGLMRVERVLALVRDATVEALARRAARMRRLRLVPSATLTPGLGRRPGARAGLRLSGRGRRPRDFARIARRAVRASASAAPSATTSTKARWSAGRAWTATGSSARGSRGGWAATLIMSPTREPDTDPAYGIRILSGGRGRAAISESYKRFLHRAAGAAAAPLGPASPGTDAPGRLAMSWTPTAACGRR